jgi:hypothetical protein
MWGGSLNICWEFLSTPPWCLTESGREDQIHSDVGKLLKLKGSRPISSRIRNNGLLSPAKYPELKISHPSRDLSGNRHIGISRRRLNNSCIRRLKKQSFAPGLLDSEPLPTDLPSKLVVDSERWDVSVRQTDSISTNEFFVGRLDATTRLPVILIWGC